MNKNEIVVATSNQGKLREYKLMLEPLGYKVISLKDINMTLDVEETGSTFAENSLIKARYIAKQLHDKIVIADDSGLEIHGLNGFPGIYSARFMEGSPYDEKNLAIIEKMKDLKDRTANFTTVISLVNFDEKDHTFSGKAFGHIEREIEGNNGFGYDPIFYSDDLNKTFGNSTNKEKSSISHRGKALVKLVNYIKQTL